MPGKKVTKVQQSASSDDEIPGSSDADEGLWLERCDHPLLNDVVLKVLFEYVRPRDVKECRLVSNKWSVHTLPLTRSTLEVTITGKISSNSPHPANHGTRDFLKLFGSKSLHFPFTQFQLGSFDPTIGLGKKCVQLIGEMAKKIDLDGTDETHYVENISSLLRSVPNLEYFATPIMLLSKKVSSSDVVHKPRKVKTVKLFSGPKFPSLNCLKTLEVGGEDASQRRKVCPTFFEELLTAAENISSILTSHSMTFNGTSLELLQIIEKLGRESRVKVLSITHVDEKNLEVLRKMVGKKDGLKLKHLGIMYGCSQGTVDPWSQLIEMMKHSLVSLQIYNNSDTPTQFPEMPDLKLLDLDINVGIVDFNDFGNTFPALQYLRLSSNKKRELDDLYLGSSDESCPVLESFVLVNFILNIRSFERTLDVFPNLKELEMSITVDAAEILQKIWTHMTRLEKLSISGRLRNGNNVESLIIGIPANGFNKIKGGKLNWQKNMTKEVRRETISALINEHRTLPSIGNLTNLRHLTLNLTGKPGKNNSHLSDLTGYLGLYSLTNLDYLNIYDTKLSMDCCMVLVEDMRLVGWQFQSPQKLKMIPSRWKSEDYFDWDDFPSSKFSFNYRQ